MGSELKQRPMRFRQALSGANLCCCLRCRCHYRRRTFWGILCLVFVVVLLIVVVQLLSFEQVGLLGAALEYANPLDSSSVVQDNDETKDTLHAKGNFGLEDPYGRSCNNLISIVGLLELATSRKVPGVALDQDFTQVLLDLNVDIEFFSRSKPGLSFFIGCTFDKKVLVGNCTHEYRNGEILGEDTRLITLAHVVSGAVAYYYQPKSTDVFAYLQLQREYARIVEESLKKLRNGGPLVGIHRRALEGTCYRLTSERPGVPSFRNHSLFLPGGRCEGVTIKGLEMTEKDVQCYRDVSMDYSFCNFTLSDEEITFVDKNAAWGPFFRRREFSLILATDSQDRKGDAAIRARVPTFEMCHFLQSNISTSSLLFAEMHALSLVDYLITQPESSCDGIVQLWREKRSNYSSLRTFPGVTLFPRNNPPDWVPKPP